MAVVRTWSRQWNNRLVDLVVHGQQLKVQSTYDFARNRVVIPGLHLDHNFTLREALGHNLDREPRLLEQMPTIGSPCDTCGAPARPNVADLVWQIAAAAPSRLSPAVQRVREADMAEPEVHVTLVYSPQFGRRSWLQRLTDRHATQGPAPGGPLTRTSADNSPSTSAVARPSPPARAPPTGCGERTALRAPRPPGAFSGRRRRALAVSVASEELPRLGPRPREPAAPQRRGARLPELVGRPQRSSAC